MKDLTTTIADLTAYLYAQLPHDADPQFVSELQKKLYDLREQQGVIE